MATACAAPPPPPPPPLLQGVFVHRYRDSAPAIRSDVLSVFGLWLSADPSTFVQNAYLKYVGWMLSDGDEPEVRVQAAAAIGRLYSLPAVDPARLDEFMTRFRSESRARERGLRRRRASRPHPSTQRASPR